MNFSIGADLVTLATPRTGALPNGVVLCGETDLRLLGLEMGATVWSEGERLSCNGVTIELAGAEDWSPLLKVHGELRPLDEVREALRQALRRRPVSSGLLEDLARYGGSGLTPYALRELVETLGGCDLDGAVVGARKLIGLGHGLTPSCDDVLIGLCAALRAGEHPLHEEFAGACARVARGRTTTVAEMFYRYAARGAFSERLHRVVAGMSTPGVDLRREFELALDWGASSGADCLLGLLVGTTVAQARG